MEGKTPKKHGRPAIYTQELADRVCLEVATTTRSLRTICKKPGMPSVTSIFKWIQEDTNGFAEQYARAKEEQADMMVEEMMDISEHTKEDHTAFTGTNVVQRDRLRIETRKWIASKLKPKKYGEKMDVTNRTVNYNVPLTKEEAQELNKLLEDEY